MLSTQAMLKAVGVGDAQATSTSALLTWVFQDGVGMIGRILFTWRYSQLLDMDLKTWRLAADWLNDFGMFLTLVAPLANGYAAGTSIYFMCIGTLFKALCGVTGGSTRGSLTQHFARANNMADIGAKDGSQETIINLLGMFAGTWIVTRIDQLKDDHLILWATWILFGLLTVVHLWSNYLAVKNVVLDYLNLQRLQIVCRELFLHDCILTPNECAQQESIFWWHLTSRMPPLEIGAVYTSNQKSGWIHPQKARYKLDVRPNKIRVAIGDAATDLDIARGCVHAYHVYYTKILKYDLIPFERVFQKMCDDMEQVGWESMENLKLHLVDGGFRYKQAKTK